MSAITEYARLRDAELAELRRQLLEDPHEAYRFAGDLADGEPDDDGAPRGMDTDKAWAGLAYLLIRLNPPIDVIGGGTPLTDQVWGYDSPRLLASDEVVTASRFLGRTPFEALEEQYNPAELAAAEVYPEIWDQEWALGYLKDAYTRLETFFRAAAERRDSILVWTS